MMEPAVHGTWIKRTRTRATPAPTRFPYPGYQAITPGSEVRSILIEATQRLENEFGRGRVEPMYRLVGLLNDGRMPIQTSHCSTVHSQRPEPPQHRPDSLIRATKQSLPAQRSALSWSDCLV